MDRIEIYHSLIAQRNLPSVIWIIQFEAIKESVEGFLEGLDEFPITEKEAWDAYIDFLYERI